MTLTDEEKAIIDEQCIHQINFMEKLFGEKTSLKKKYADEIFEVLNLTLGCIEASTEFRIGNPAFEQAQAKAKSIIRKVTL